MLEKAKKVISWQEPAGSERRSERVESQTVTPPHRKHSFAFATAVVGTSPAAPVRGADRTHPATHDRRPAEDDIGSGQSKIESGMPFDPAATTRASPFDRGGLGRDPRPRWLARQTSCHVRVKADAREKRESPCVRRLVAMNPANQQDERRRSSEDIGGTAAILLWR